MTIEYLDSYLLPRIDNNSGWEDRARADVAALGAFPDYWNDRLIMLKVYIYCCLESLASADDVFSVKLKEYRKEFESALIAARIAIQSPPPGFAAQTPFLSIPIARA